MNYFISDCVLNCSEKDDWIWCVFTEWIIQFSVLTQHNIIHHINIHTYVFVVHWMLGVGVSDVWRLFLRLLRFRLFLRLLVHRRQCHRHRHCRNQIWGFNRTQTLQSLHLLCPHLLHSHSPLSLLPLLPPTANQAPLDHQLWSSQRPQPQCHIHGKQSNNLFYPLRFIRISFCSICFWVLLCQAELGLNKELREMLPIIVYKESFSVKDTQWVHYLLSLVGANTAKTYLGCFSC